VSRVFVDTSALLALLDRADPRHQVARDAFTRLVDHELLTHGYVVAETLAVARRRFGVDGVIALLDDVLPAMTLLPVDAGLHAAAQASYRNSLPSGTSFVDQVSFKIIEHEAIEVAFALDSDFETAGIRVIPASVDPPG
jgi:predicted nucleic acid-binding protein